VFEVAVPSANAGEFELRGALAPGAIELVVPAGEESHLEGGDVCLERGMVRACRRREKALGTYSTDYFVVCVHLAPEAMSLWVLDLCVTVLVSDGAVALDGSSLVDYYTLTSTSRKFSGGP
jgi:hypothetical protein